MAGIKLLCSDLGGILTALALPSLCALIVLFLIANRFEKLISGLYMCESVRIILATLAERGVLFSGVSAPGLMTKGILKFQDILDMME